MDVVVVVVVVVGMAVGVGVLLGHGPAEIFWMNVKV